MNFYKDKIIFTGGSGRFGRIFKSEYSFKNIYYPSKKNLICVATNQLKNFLRKTNQKLWYTLLRYQDQ